MRRTVVLAAALVALMGFGTALNSGSAREPIKSVDSVLSVSSEHQINRSEIVVGEFPFFTLPWQRTTQTEGAAKLLDAKVATPAPSPTVTEAAPPRPKQPRVARDKRRSVPPTTTTTTVPATTTTTAYQTNLEMAEAAHAAAYGTTTTTAQPEEHPLDEKWVALADCESGDHDGKPPYTPDWDINAYHDGGLQFNPGTWNSNAGPYLKEYPYAYQAPPWVQIEVGKVTLSRSSWKQQWPACSAKLGYR